MKLLTILLLCPILSFADTINCKVVGIKDGDTITCLTDKKEQLTIRLYQIDAPEKKQAFGTKSRQALSNLIFNKTVRIETHKTDKYRRTLGTIYRKYPICKSQIDLNRNIGCWKSKNINLEMIKRGMAWYYPFAKKDIEYQLAEQTARKNKVGLWSDKNPVAPWEFRKSN